MEASDARGASGAGLAREAPPTGPSARAGNAPVAQKDTPGKPVCSCKMGFAWRRAAARGPQANSASTNRSGSKGSTSS
jgi:hypothetical protein